MIFWGIVPAAGEGTRFHAPYPKQYQNIEGSTVLEHSLRALLGFGVLERVVVGLAAGDTLWERCPCAGWEKILAVQGGKTRAETVMHALDALLPTASPEDWVIVHDAARPALTQRSLFHFIDAVKDEAVGGVSGSTVSDAVKLKSAESEVLRTLPKGSVFLAATPQMFRYSVLYKALSEAIESGTEVGDEAEAVELAGYTVRLIESDCPNPKLTHPKDLEWMKTLLRPSEN